MQKLNALDALLQRFSKGELHHGLIFHGNSLDAIEQEALILTRNILDIDERNSEHPDLFHLRPTGKMRVITVEKTRSLIAELHRTSNQGGAKVALIHEADRMRKEAANAFLKTLEEPPPETYLLLLTSRSNSMLATIRSRCLSIRINRETSQEDDDNWREWKVKYDTWIGSLLDRDSLSKDRVTPLFIAYGLTAGFLHLVKEKADLACRSALDHLASELEEKEKDAFETGIRKRIRTEYFRKLADSTREVVAKNGRNPVKMEKLATKLTKVIKRLEKCSGLLEVNLKEDAALEDFYLSSLRIWSAK